MNPDEVVCTSETPLLTCDYEEVFEYGQSCAKTCLVCTQGSGSDSQEIYRSCEGNAGGTSPSRRFVKPITLLTELVRFVATHITTCSLQVHALKL